MAFKLAVLLLACLLVITGCANENMGDLDAFLDRSDMGSHLAFHNARDDLVEDDSIFGHRDDLPIVTVTEFVCGSGEPTSGQPPIFSIPETTLLTDTIAPSPAPGTEQPPVSSGTDGAPSVEPTSAESTETTTGPTAEPTGIEPSSTGQTSSDSTSAGAPTTASPGQTTTLQSSSATSDTPTSADGTGAPTETSDTPSSTSEVPINLGSTQGGMNSFGLVVALTFILLVGL
ncbi:hypothetical protein BDV18DRAFT_58994 [Aspergillus unguis]